MQPKQKISNPIIAFRHIMLAIFCIFFLITANIVSAQKGKENSLTGKGNSMTSTPDDSYGKGGSKMTICDTTKKADGTIEYFKIITYFDPQGHSREEITIGTNDRSDLHLDSTHTTHEKLNNGDEISKSTSIKRDDLGNEIYREEGTSLKKAGEKYENKKSGSKNENGKVQIYNPKTQKWEDKKDDSSQPNPFIANQFFIGFSLIREDSKPTSFFTYGGELDFNHFISQNVGLTVDLGLNFGSSMGIDYTKRIVLVGAYADIVSRTFKNQPGLDVNVHLLGGVSSITSSVGTFKFTSNVFTADLGVGAGIPLNKEGSFRLGINLDYIPTFSGAIKNNIRGSAGLKFGIKSKHSHKVKTLDKPIQRAKID